ncbi:MAG: stage III sporulation protein AB [Clostridia bacterium]|nr:stage III sporulation protein AB [Clostridia bacterium]
MIILKTIILILIFAISYLIGNMVAKLYSKRVEELEDMKNSLNLLQTKVRFSKEPLSKIFKEISNISLNKEIFDKSNENMKTMLAGEAWRNAIKTVNNNLKKEDIDILLSLGNMLGKTDSEGQVNQIEEIKELLNIQIKNANLEKQKNEKLYKTLGMTVGLAIVIILI